MADETNSPSAEDLESQDDKVTQAVDEGENPTPAAEPADQGGYADPNEPAGYSDAPAGVPDKSESEDTAMKVQGCLVGLIVTSCAEMAQAAKTCTDLGDTLPNFECKEEYMWAVLVGGISMFLNIVFFAGIYMNVSVLANNVQYFAVFMMIWWGFGVAICTFNEPFTTTGNGYFATWGSAIISVYFAQITFAKLNACLGKAFTSAMTGNKERRVLMLIMIFSWTLVYACIQSDAVDIDSSTFEIEEYTSEELWGIACGSTVGGIITLYMLIKTLKASMVANPNIVKYMSYFFTIMWLFGVGVLTFQNPFLTTGNGYFTSWGAFLASIYLAYITTMMPTPETPAAS